MGISSDLWGDEICSLSSNTSRVVEKGKSECVARVFFEGSGQVGYLRGNPRENHSYEYHPYRPSNAVFSPTRFSQSSIERKSFDPASKLPEIYDRSRDPRSESTESQWGKLDYENGNSYEGELLEDKPHGRGKYTCADGAFYEGDWKNGIALSNASHLGEDLFFNLLCKAKESLQSEPPEGYCLGIMVDYLQMKGYEDISSLLKEAYRIFIFDGSLSEDETEYIFNELTEKKSPRLFASGTFDHAIGLCLVPDRSSDSVLCEIFNTGDGLDFHRRHPDDPRKFQTTLQVKMPLKSVTKELIDCFSYRFDSVERLYSTIFNLPGAEMVLSDTIPWGDEQEGNECSLLWILHLCMTRMSEKEYMKMVSQLEIDCRNANDIYRKMTKLQYPEVS